jgi:hypothetical protein
VRGKLLAAAVVVFVVWDLNPGGSAFDDVFWFLGRDKIVGAESGTVWEWCVAACVRRSIDD